MRQVDPLQARILVLDDDADTAELMGDALRVCGHHATVVTTADLALDALAQDPYDVLLTDLHLGEVTGIDVCKRALELRPEITVVVVTGDTSLASAVAAMRGGAHDYVVKPLDIDALQLTMHRVLRHGEVRTEVRRLRQLLAEVPSATELLGQSRPMRQLLEVVSRVAPTFATVLITGESGAGKELVARAVHAQSTRSEGPFVAINCAAVPPNLLDSELFGHVRGAFTDARVSRPGLFVEANGGTLLLDEIGDMPLEMQVKLLRALQERTVRPVGGSTEVPFDTRIIAATNLNLEAEIKAGRFREDLFYRINVVALQVPALRERPSDIPILTAHFLASAAKRSDIRMTEVAPAVLERLLAYDWPGNVRELENCVERAIALATTSTFTYDLLPARIREFRPERLSLATDAVEELISLPELERRYMIHVLKLVGGNKSKAARILGVDRRTLYRRFDQFEKTNPSAAGDGNGASSGAVESNNSSLIPPALTN